MKKLSFLFILTLLPLLASAQTVSDVKDSGCLYETRGDGVMMVPTIILEKDGSVLSVQLLNYEENCCTEGFNVTSSIGEGSPCSVAVSVEPDGEYACDCICPFNVSFTIRDLEPNSFYLDCWWYKGLVELRKGEPLVLAFSNGTVTVKDDYIPFVESGKSWHVVRSDYAAGCHIEHYTLTNKEEIVRGGKTYMKMYRSEDDLTVVYDTGLFREENRKVYGYDPEREEEHLMFDYSLKAGDTYETYSYDEQSMVSYKVISVDDYQEGPEVIRYIEGADSIMAQHRYLRKWTVCRTDNEAFQKTWIEGVGSLEGPLGNLYEALPVTSRDWLAYVEHNDGDYLYLPFSFHDTMNRQVHGCNLPTHTYNVGEDYGRHRLTYELEGDRLHVYGEVFTNCGPNDYAFFYEKPTDDPMVHKVEFEIQGVEPLKDCMGLHATDFYVPGFDPTLNYIIVDNQGEEHPVINKAAQMAYRPFVEDGKVWKVGTISGNPVQIVDYYYFDGDTIIGGRACKQMMCQRFVGPDYSNEYSTPTPSLTKVGAWYEEDKKVYFYDEQQQSMVLKYDFSLGDNDSLQLIDDYPPFVIGPRQTGGIVGFKGVHRNVMINRNMKSTTWLEGVGGIEGPTRNAYAEATDHLPEFLMSCAVGDEVIFLNDEYEDGATPEAARKGRFDFSHTIKIKPKAPRRFPAETDVHVYGEYNDLQLDINLGLLDDAYQVRIANESGEPVYEKTVDAGTVVALSIDISAYTKGCYTVTIENSEERFTGQFDTQTTGISDAPRLTKNEETSIYNLQGQRMSTLQRGINIVNGQKLYVK